MKGIDVSYYQNDINWDRVKAAGVEFAIIRAGFRGYAAAGKLAEDPRFRENIQGAAAVGIPVGVYFLSQATTPEEGREEARFCLELARPHKLDFPVYIDSEYSSNHPNGRADSLSKEARTAAVVAFCDEVEAAGYYAGIYASESWFVTNLGNVNRFDKWVAKWTGDPTISHGIWQRSNTGRVDGIATDVDLNVSYKDYPTIIREAGLNQPQDDTTDLQAEVERLQKEAVKLSADLQQARAEKKNILDQLRKLIEEYQ